MDLPRRLATVVLAGATLVAAAPPAQAADWRFMVRDHGGRLEGCVVSKPGEDTAGWIVKVRGNNSAGRHGHRFGVSALLGGPAGENKSKWRARVDKGRNSAPEKIRLYGAGDWLGVGMGDYDGTGEVGSVFDPARLRRC